MTPQDCAAKTAALQERFIAPIWCVWANGPSGWRCTVHVNEFAAQMEYKTCRDYGRKAFLCAP